MKRVLSFFLLVYLPVLQATPTSQFWTICTTDIVPKDIIDFNYIGLVRTGHSRNGISYIQDYGITLGAFSWNNLEAEIGIDYYSARKSSPIYFNGKIGVQEGVLYKGSPAINVGIYNIGTRTKGLHRTNENIVDLIIGKTLPQGIGGKLTIGFFSGSSVIGKNRQGVMIGYARSLQDARDSNGNQYAKVLFIADYSSGKNVQGGGGLSLKYFVTNRMSFQTGPIWFNDHSYYGKWRWALMFDLQM